MHAPTKGFHRLMGLPPSYEGTAHEVPTPKAAKHRRPHRCSRGRGRRPWCYQCDVGLGDAFWQYECTFCGRRDRHSHSLQHSLPANTEPPHFGRRIRTKRLVVAVLAVVLVAISVGAVLTVGTNGRTGLAAPRGTQLVSSFSTTSSRARRSILRTGTPPWEAKARGPGTPVASRPETPQPGPRFIRPTFLLRR